MGGCEMRGGLLVFWLGTPGYVQGRVGAVEDGAQLETYACVAAGYDYDLDFRVSKSSGGFNVLSCGPRGMRDDMLHRLKSVLTASRQVNYKVS